MARHDRLAADPLDGAGIQLALEWEWERVEHGIPDGIARENLAASIGGFASIGNAGEGGEPEPGVDYRGGNERGQEEAA